MPKDTDSPEKPKLPDKPAGEVLARVYDRVKLGTVLGKPPAFGKAPVTRIELVMARFYDKDGSARLGKMPTMANPLAKLRAGYAGSQIATANRNWWSFLSACQTHSPEAAASFLGLSPSGAINFKQAMQVPNPDLLEPSATWKRWMDGLTQTGLAQLLCT